MQNRIDIDFDEKGFQQIRSSVQTFLAHLQKYTRTVSAKERKDGQSMGETTGWTYAQKAFEIPISSHFLHKNLIHLHPSEDFVWFDSQDSDSCKVFFG